MQSYSIPDIAKIEFGSTATSAIAPPAPTSSLNDERTLRPARTDSQPSSSTTAAEIPIGTQLVVRFIDNVDSEVDRPGKTYRASLDEPVVIAGETVIARGSDIVAKLVEDKQSGKLSGKTELTLDLVTVTVNGKPVDIDTEEVVKSSNNRTSGTLKKTLGLGALGAIIGGIAGGGRGAAVGATAGAGTGAAIQVLTKGEKVQIPSETRLNFILQNPIRL